MKTTKKLSIVLLVAGFGFFSCGGDSNSSSTTENGTKTPTMPETRPMEPESDGLNPDTKPYVPQIEVPSLKTEEEILDAMQQIKTAMIARDKMEADDPEKNHDAHIKQSCLNSI